MTILLFSALLVSGIDISKINLEDNPSKHSIYECKTLLFQPARATDASLWPQRITAGKTHFAIDQGNVYKPFAVEKGNVYKTLLPKKPFRKIMSILDLNGKMGTREDARSARGYIFWCQDYWAPGIKIRYPRTSIRMLGKPEKEQPVEPGDAVLDTGPGSRSIKNDDMLKIIRIIRESFRKSALPAPFYVPLVEQEGDILP